ncbi:unnamed protein product [Periconia digitata]|uniref:SP-RING-type domain-containing protein n=1 Tax=Periconia digitata TaxID=1303443 RepID=A0A9W4UA16_9PLEO|nr:unnamed protein product [Periconia digitata]
MSTRNRIPAYRSSVGRTSLTQDLTSSAIAFDTLPPYKKPSHPLTIRAQDQIKALNGRPIEQIKEHSKEAEKRLTNAAELVNDKAREHNENIAKRRKRWDQGLDTKHQENEETWSAQFQEKADSITAQLEESMRGVIDTSVGAERMAESIKWLHQHAPGRLEQEFNTQQNSLSQSQRRRDTQISEVVSDGPTPGPTPLDGSRPVLSGIGEIFEERLNRKKDEYTSRSLYDRYAENRAYADFKAMVHDAKYGNEEAPPRETWFPEQGLPALGVTQRGADDEEDDIVVNKATVSTKCPVTFQKFREPLTSSKCPHTFEKYAIMEMIGRSKTKVGSAGNRSGGEKAVECPVPGCSQVSTDADLMRTSLTCR